MGCTLPDGRTYVVPITFAYADGAIYSFSYPGQKIDAMIRNPSVCFQTEQFVHEGVWKSVIVWGTFEHLSHKQQLGAMKAIFDRLEREEGRAMSPLYQPPPGILAASVPHSLENQAVFYRIRLTEKTGRQVQQS